jgi:hypothetical protein
MLAGEVFMRLRVPVVVLMFSSLLCSVPAMAQQPTPISAQRHVAAPSAVREAIATQVAKDQLNRDTLVGALRHPEVRVLADQLGLNLVRAENAVTTLSSTELASMTATLGVGVDRAGGANTVVISTTTLLLVLIVVILLVR